MKSSIRWRCVIIGGLFTSTVLNLFLLPAICLRYGSSGEGHLEAARRRAG